MAPLSGPQGHGWKANSNCLMVLMAGSREDRMAVSSRPFLSLRAPNRSGINSMAATLVMSHPRSPRWARRNCPGPFNSTRVHGRWPEARRRIRSRRFRALAALSFDLVRIKQHQPIPLIARSVIARRGLLRCVSPQWIRGAFPVASNIEAASRQLNRRAEIVIGGDEGAAIAARR
jgi:hypothetical protein